MSTCNISGAFLLLLSIGVFALFFTDTVQANCTAQAQNNLFCIPSTGVVTGRFNDVRSDGNGGTYIHHAIDISGGVSGNKGNPIYAPYAGKVVYVGTDPAERTAAHIVAINHGFILNR